MMQATSYADPPTPAVAGAHPIGSRHCPQYGAMQDRPGPFTLPEDAAVLLAVPVNTLRLRIKAGQVRRERV